MKTKTVSDFGKVKVKSYSSNMKQNTPTELLAFPKFETQGKDGLPHPGRPQIGIFPYPLRSAPIEHSESEQSALALPAL